MPVRSYVQCLHDADGINMIRMLLSSFRPSNAIEQREGGEIVVSFNENLETVRMG